MNNETSKYEDYRKKIRLFHQFTVSTTSANLWIDVAGYHLSKRITTDALLEPCLICLQYLPNKR